MPRPFVVYWNNIPSPYMVERFNALADRGGTDFEAWFNDRLESDRSWDVNESSWRFRYRYLPVIRIGRHRFHWPSPILGRRPDLLVSLHSPTIFVVGWLIAKLRDVRTCFRVLKTYDRWVSRHPLKESLKRFMFKRVDGIETTGDDGRQFAMLYGVPVERIFFATHTVDIEYYRSGVREAATKRDLLRREQSLAGTVFIYVGRLWWGKGLNDLMAAFERVQQLSASEVSLVLVGDGPQELELKRTCVERGLRNVVFAGFSQKDQLVDFYAMSDVFVFPTLGDPYGLVVDEAMAASLPVISSSAAGEIRDRVEEGINGYIVPPEDSEALANSMLRLVDNSDLCERMGKASAEKIAGHTPEQWADDFASIVNRLLHKN